MKRACVASLLALVALGCRQPDRALSGVVDAPPGSRWKKAWVARRSSSTPYGGRNFGSRTTVTVDLFLSDGQKREQYVLSEYGEIPTDAKLRLAFAPDSHALAIRKEEDASWCYVALEGCDSPIYCPHWTFGTLDDPWRGAPTTRDLVVDILSAGPASAHHGEGVTSREVIPAASFACAHRDETMMMALVQLAREGAPLPSADLAFDCLVEEGKRSPELRGGLLAAAIGNKADDRATARKWAARVLGSICDASAQDGLAALLSDEMAVSNANLDKTWHEALPEIAQALATVTEARHGANDATIRNLLTALTSDACIPTPDCDAVREQAVNALAAIDPAMLASPQDQVASALVDVMANSCDGENSQGDRRGVLAWALAALTKARGSATESAQSALIAAATHSAPCRGSCESDCALMRVHAILALGLLSTPPARRALDGLAGQSCDEPMDADGLDVWSRPLYVEADKHTLPCWAALADRDRTRP